MSYTCENAVGAEKNCDFRSGQVILQQIIEPAQMTKLLSTGRTDLLTNFKSARTGRLFKAYLVWDKKAGKTVFEFEAKAPKATKTAEKKTTAKAAQSNAEADAKPSKPAKKTATKAKPKNSAKDDVMVDDTPPLSAYDDEPPF